MRFNLLYRALPRNEYPDNLVTERLQFFRNFVLSQMVRRIQPLFEEFRTTTFFLLFQLQPSTVCQI